MNKNCPLCNNNVELIKIGNEYCTKTCFEIKCKKCNLKLKQCKLNKSFVITEDKLKEKVLETWNNRKG